MTDLPHELHDLLIRFLATRGESTGGWAEVAPNDIGHLHVIIHAILAAKYDKDPDGDLPIDWHLIDRSRFEAMRFRAVPYRHKVEGAHEQEAKEAILRAHLFNMRSAMESLDRELRDRKAEK